jgi:hypothetical protein
MVFVYFEDGRLDKMLGMALPTTTQSRALVQTPILTLFSIKALICQQLCHFNSLGTCIVDEHKLNSLMVIWSNVLYTLILYLI